MWSRVAAEACVLGLAVVWIYMLLDQIPSFHEMPVNSLPYALALMVFLLFGGVASTIHATDILPHHVQQHMRVEQDSGILVGLTLVPIVISSRLMFVWAEYHEFSDYTHVHLWLSLLIATSSIIRLATKVSWSFANAILDILFVHIVYILLPIDQVTSYVHIHATIAAYNITLHFGFPFLSHSFTFGEGMLISQGVAFLAIDALLFSLKQFGMSLADIPSRDGFSIVLQLGLLSALVMPALCIPLFRVYGTSTPRIIRPTLPPSQTAIFLGLLALVALNFIVWASILLNEPLWLWVLENLVVSSKLMVAGYWIVVLAVVVPVCPILAKQLGLKQIVSRKLYHVLAVLMFLPVDMLRLSYGVAVGVFVVVECIRALAVPPFGRHIALFIRVYLDHRDEGRVVLSHTYLLLGCALPTWILSGLPASSTSFVLIANAGVLALGIGDAMGAAVGSTMGKTKIVGKKSLEGSIAMFASMVIVSFACHSYHWDFVQGKYASAIAFASATLLTAALEAITMQIDNLVLPLFYCATCCLTACSLVK
ncbi:hypothetical protein Ae201684P_008779 [Aphanomyces euteiches]|nr:hypothetical protein Ae201684P_008779 [Aphanomyces euteiches]